MRTPTKPNNTVAEAEAEAAYKTNNTIQRLKPPLKQRILCRGSFHPIHGGCCDL
jgi:hypothetical protein